MKKFRINVKKQIVATVSGLVTVGAMVSTPAMASSTPQSWSRPCSTTSGAMFPSAHVAEENGAAPMMPGHQMEVASSVQVSREVLRDAYQASREAYTKKLQKYAKVSSSEAAKAVNTAHPGMKVEGLQLRNIRTSLVFAAVVSDDQDKYLVLVDAGNGKILMDRRLETHHERVFANHE